MDDKAFWALIGKIDWTSEDDEVRLAPLVKSIANSGKAAIIQFWSHLAVRLQQLDTPNHWKGAGSINSDDIFLYQRAGVVANGETFFSRILNDPSSFPKDLEFENLLYAVDFAWERMTGEELVDPSPLDYSINIESFSSPAWADQKP